MPRTLHKTHFGSVRLRPLRLSPSAPSPDVCSPLRLWSHFCRPSVPSTPVPRAHCASPYIEMSHTFGVSATLHAPSRPLSPGGASDAPTVRLEHVPPESLLSSFAEL